MTITRAFGFTIDTQTGVVERWAAGDPASVADRLAALPDCHGSSLGKSWLLAAARAIEAAVLAANGLEVRRG